MINIYTDGGSRGNPGLSAIGVHIIGNKGETLFSLGEKIGIATNNVAEYKAVIAGLDWVLKNMDLLKEEEEICFHLDSELVAFQINGLYRVKNQNLAELIFKLREKEVRIKKKIIYRAIPRELNRQADRLVNLALDNKV